MLLVQGIIWLNSKPILFRDGDLGAELGGAENGGSLLGWFGNSGAEFKWFRNFGSDFGS